SAVRHGVKAARHDWIYLLNNDMTLERGALAEVMRWRAPDVFAVASQIFPTNPTQFGEEAGPTDSRGADGPFWAFCGIPEDQETVCGHVYAGGGASLFRKELLWRLLPQRDPYDPFYGEDMEWGMRAWRLGFEVLFCPTSRAGHLRHVTVSRFYAPAEVDRI